MANTKISALSSATTPLSGSEIVPLNQSGVTDSVSVANLTAGRAVSGSSFAVTGTTAPANGMYLYATNSVGFATNSTFSALIDSSQNWRIGHTYAPSTTTGLSVQGVYNSSAPSTSSNVNIRASGGGAVSVWISSYAYSYGWIQAIQDDGTNNIKPLYLQPLGGDTRTGGNVVPQVAGTGINFTANTPGSGMTSQNLTWYEEGSYTPTVAATSGTLTSYTAVAEYTRVGRVITFVTNVTITNAGTGSGALTVSLPFTANGSYAFNGAGRENALTGFMLQGYISAGGTVVNIVNYSNATAIATNAQIRMTITYTV
jgi:hypothetical protein